MIVNSGSRELRDPTAAGWHLRNGRASDALAGQPFTCGAVRTTNSQTSPNATRRHLPPSRCCHGAVSGDVASRQEMAHSGIGDALRKMDAARVTGVF
jgi:hypothetical protein